MLAGRVRQRDANPDLGDPFLDALAAGRNPDDDPTVQAPVAARALAGYNVGIDDALTRRTHDLLDT